MRNNKFFILFILLFVMLGCGSRQEQKNNAGTIEKDTYRLTGKRISSVDSIIPNKMYRVIFYSTFMIVEVV